MNVWNIAGAVFTIVAGSLLHFVYGLCGGRLAAVIGSVNESTWEHLKLAFWPMLFFSAVEYAAYGRDVPGFIPVKAASIFIALIAVIVLFYTYTGVLGRHFLLADIGVFVAGVIIAYRFAFRQLSDPHGIFTLPASNAAAAVFLAALALAFAAFTFCPPDMGLFDDPTGAIKNPPKLT